MEKLSLRYPHIWKMIFDHLDNHDLVSSRLVNKDWKSGIDNGNILWIRIIREFIKKSVIFINGAFIYGISCGLEDHTYNIKGSPQQKRFQEAIEKYKKPWNIILNKAPMNFIKELGKTLQTKWHCPQEKYIRSINCHFCLFLFITMKNSEF